MFKPYTIEPAEEAKAKPDVFSLEGLIDWLETKPADEVYCYFDSGKCLAALFHAYAARPDYHPVILCFGPEHGKEFEYLLEDISCEVPYTFGAALIRARAALGRGR